MPVSLDFNNLFSQMLTAAKTSFNKKWPKIKDLATSSVKTLAQNVVDIEQMRIAGTITEEQARLKLDLQKNAFKTVLLTEEGIGLLVVESALNAMLGIIKDTVNTAIGFALI
ncbi:MAG TPA: hypothetical protein VNU70_00670 [Puia sp.]|jgi:hypothetical protein|nr:hypothetical protein [Puia sp.]